MDIIWTDDNVRLFTSTQRAHYLDLRDDWIAAMADFGGWTAEGICYLYGCC